MADHRRHLINHIETLRATCPLLGEKGELKIRSFIEGKEALIDLLTRPLDELTGTPEGLLIIQAAIPQMQNAINDAQTIKDNKGPGQPVSSATEFCSWAQTNSVMKGLNYQHEHSLSSLMNPPTAQVEARKRMPRALAGGAAPRPEQENVLPFGLRTTTRAAGPG